MRLLNTKTLELSELGEGDGFQYAILSHTWGDEEVTYQDLMSNKKGRIQHEHKKGFSKISGACEKARSMDIDWIWIDTCCIDKSSSAELSEAINSMYNWYQWAFVCLAYLSDVHDPVDMAQFSASRWFTRGWTLQELLAPQNMNFYTSAWKLIGSKDDGERAPTMTTPDPADMYDTFKSHFAPAESDTAGKPGLKTDLASHISAATGIRESRLRDSLLSEKASVAEIMSWASKRETSREEDIAYCLLGLFGVNMPLLYGEGGKKAFLRLQKEIMAVSDDQSIFAWGWGYSPERMGSGNPSMSYVAASPTDFEHCGDIILADVDAPEIDLVTTNRGIALESPLCQGYEISCFNGYFIPIKCRPRDEVCSLLAISVMRRSETREEYHRTLKNPPILVPTEAWDTQSLMTRYLKHAVYSLRVVPSTATFALRQLPPGFEIVETWPEEHWRRLTPAPNKPIGQLTKAIWTGIGLRGYVHLRHSGNNPDAASNATDDRWPDVLLRLNAQKQEAEFTAYPGGTASLAEFVRKEWESVPYQEAVTHWRCTLGVKKLQVGSRYITANVQAAGDPTQRRGLIVVDVITSSCQAWSVDACLRDTCGLELVRRNNKLS